MRTDNLTLLHPRRVDMLSIAKVHEIMSQPDWQDKLKESSKGQLKWVIEQIEYLQMISAF